MPNEWVELLKTAPDLIKEIYGDLAKPGAAQVGKALESVLGLGNTVLFPVALLNAKARHTLEANIEKYRKQLEDTSSEHIIPVVPEIGVPIMEKLAYVSDDEISNLYITLLAKASDRRTTGVAHPSFVNIIGNLSPDEALIIKRLSQNSVVLFVTGQWHFNSKNQWVGAGKEFLTGIEDEIQLVYPQNLETYLSNFIGLGLVDVRRDVAAAAVEKYKALEEKYRPELLKTAFTVDPQGPLAGYEFNDLRFVRGRMDLTAYGTLFAQSCLKRIST